MSRMNSPLSRARGHGSARSGTHHWLAQRISAVLLLFLMPWMIYALVCGIGSTHAETIDFIARPLNSSLLILSLLVLLYHGMLGLQVVIEDYVHKRALELVLHVAVRAGTMIAATLGVVYVLKITLGV
jgi:succinate dehydrogenase / fumarate reductase membrane anchor subunit